MMAVSSDVSGSVSEWLDPAQRLALKVLPVFTSLMVNTAPRGMVLLPQSNQSRDSVAGTAEEAEPLKYLTPFGYADGASVMGDEKLQIGYLATGAVMAAVGVALAYWKYTRKDIQ